MGLRLRALRMLLRDFVKPRKTRDNGSDALRHRIELLLKPFTGRTPLALERRALASPSPAAESSDGAQALLETPTEAPALEYLQRDDPIGPGGSGAGDAFLLYLPGGGYVHAARPIRKAMLRAIAKRIAFPIAALDYRLAPRHPFPAAFQDALAAWRMLRAQGLEANQIALLGESAGGGLALALTAALSAQGERPGAVVALSPWTDLAVTGGSIVRNAGREAVLSAAWLRDAANRYLCGADPKDPRASPLYARFTRPPPILIQVGSTEILKDDSLRMVEALRRAGGDVRLELLRDAPHLAQSFESVLPEAAAAMASACAFIVERLQPAAPTVEPA